MNNKVDKKIPISFQNINKYESEDNDIRFLKVKIWLMHLEENLNGSYFSREVVESAIPSLANTPILAYIEKNGEGDIDFSDHREILVRKNGDVTTKYIGKAIGTIPENNDAQFEDRLCDDGVTRTFLTVNGLLWTKFDDPIDIMKRDYVKAESMELAEDYEGEFQDDGLFHFTKFNFYGACGLGLGVLPAMNNATIEIQFSLDSFKNEVNVKMEQFKALFESDKKEKIEIDNSKDAAITSGSWADVDKSELFKEIKDASNAKSLFKEAYLIADIPSSVDDTTESDVKYPHHEIKDGKLVVSEAGVKAAYSRLMQNDPNNEEALKHINKHRKMLGLMDDDKKKEGDNKKMSKKQVAANFKLTAGQMFDEFNRVLSEVTYKTEDWWTGQLVDSCRFWLRDYDESWVYVVDCANDYIDVKLAYATEGDNIKINYDSASRIKYQPTDWEGATEGDDPDYDNDVVIDVVQDYAKKVISEAKQEFENTKQQYEAQLASAKQEYESKLSEQQDSILSMTKSIEDFTKEKEQFTAKITELEQFKSQKVQEETQAKVDELFKEYSSYLSVEEVESLKERQIEFASFDLFAKEVKALACDKITAQFKRDGKGTFAFVEKPNESQSEENLSVFDKLKKFTETK